jgi:hypothetical protein
MERLNKRVTARFCVAEVYVFSFLESGERYLNGDPQNMGWIRNLSFLDFRIDENPNDFTQNACCDVLKVEVEKI